MSVIRKLNLEINFVARKDGKYTVPAPVFQMPPKEQKIAREEGEKIKNARSINGDQNNEALGKSFDNSELENQNKEALRDLFEDPEFLQKFKESNLEALQDKYNMSQEQAEHFQDQFCDLITKWSEGASREEVVDSIKKLMEEGAISSGLAEDIEYDYLEDPEGTKTSKNKSSNDKIPKEIRISQPTNQDKYSSEHEQYPKQVKGRPLNRKAVEASEEILLLLADGALDILNEFGKGDNVLTVVLAPLLVVFKDFVKFTAMLAKDHLCEEVVKKDKNADKSDPELYSDIKGKNDKQPAIGAGNNNRGGYYHGRSDNSTSSGASVSSDDAFNSGPGGSGSGMSIS